MKTTSPRLVNKPASSITKSAGSASSPRKRRVGTPATLAPANLPTSRRRTRNRKAKFKDGLYSSLSFSSAGVLTPTSATVTTVALALMPVPEESITPDTGFGAGGIPRCTCGNMISNALDAFNPKFDMQLHFSSGNGLMPFHPSQFI